MARTFGVNVRGRYPRPTSTDEKSRGEKPRISRKKWRISRKKSRNSRKKIEKPATRLGCGLMLAGGGDCVTHAGINEIQITWARMECLDVQTMSPWNENEMIDRGAIFMSDGWNLFAEYGVPGFKSTESWNNSNNRTWKAVGKPVARILKIGGSVCDWDAIIFLTAA